MKRALLALAVGLCAAPIAARAAEPEVAAALDRARVCWAALDPECAEAALVRVRAGLDELPPEARIEALEMSAEIALSGERAADARVYLLALLELDPRFAPDDGWPSPWRAALDAARAEAPDRLPPALRVTLPAEVRPKTQVAVEVRADDPSGIARCELVLADGARIALMSADGLLFRGDIPKERVRVPELLLRVEAADRVGNVASWPASGQPQRLAVTAAVAPKEPPLTSRWWFWTAIGVVAVGSAAALVLALDGDGGAGVDSNSVGDLLVVPEVSR